MGMELFLYADLSELGSLMTTLRRITVYSVACYLSQGLQVDVFAFEHAAYLYLVDQADGLTDEQWIELGQLAELPAPRLIQLAP